MPAMRLVKCLHSSPVSHKWEPSAWGYSWATLFLWDINMGTWPSRLGEVSILRRESDPKMTALARRSNNCKLQTRYLVRGQETCNCLTVIKIWLWPTPKQTGSLHLQSSPLAARMHRFQRFCRLFNASWKSCSVRIFSTASNSASSPQLCQNGGLSVLFSIMETEKWGGWGTTVTLLLVRSSQVGKEV
jgi:hypothetical protein